MLKRAGPETGSPIVQTESDCGAPGAFGCMLLLPSEEARILFGVPRLRGQVRQMPRTA